MIPPPSHSPSRVPYPTSDPDHIYFPQQQHLKTRIPSLIPLQMDPAAVDFRAFYPYTPNEVKHRKRTTSAQLKILEGIFKRDTKPNAALRNELAAQLDMTARGVQVWFQNRRAKEKTKASKNAANKPFKSESQHDSSPSPELDATPDGPFPSESSSQESSPSRCSPPQLSVVTDSPSSWQSSPVVTPDDNFHYGQLSGDLHLLRRGSLPAGNLNPQSDLSPGTGHFDPFSRRRSVDASLHRLASNPYAHLARAKNGAICAPRISGHLKNRSHMPRSACLPASEAPSAFAGAYRAGFSNSASPSPAPSSYSIRGSLPDHNLYAFSSRAVCPPIPGPLPAPGFSFGAATIRSTSSSLTSPCSADSERSSPDLFRGFSFHSNDDLDTDDDRTSASYDRFSRFGSIASIATDSSSYYSDIEVAPDSRRPSCSSGFLGLMSNLDVNGFHESYSQEEGINAVSVALLENEATSNYPSPSSTVSARGSPLVNDGRSDTVRSLPLSKSSELAFALQSKSEPVSYVS
ncbi:hypothetical protein C8J56DRAFT_778532 [Mycena floridula]|nr:hypothetical protein C8J56DRAFT_778532 [Mycena floridula]